MESYVLMREIKYIKHDLKTSGDLQKWYTHLKRSIYVAMSVFVTRKVQIGPQQVDLRALAHVASPKQFLNRIVTGKVIDGRFQCGI